MRERPRRQAGSDGKCWYCPVCKTTKSIRHGSFFSRSKLSLQKWMVSGITSYRGIQRVLKKTQHVMYTNGLEKSALLSSFLCQLF